MRRALLIGAAVLAIALGLAGGGALAWWRSGQSPGDAQVIENGVWWTTTNAGAAGQSAALRAYVARTGILALAQTEVIYFQTRLDSEGRPLSTACDYEIAGSALDAEWWSVTVYDRTNHYFPIEGVPASFNSRSLASAADGSWRIAVSAAPKAQPWIPVLRPGPLNLLVRLYRPTEAMRAALATTALPTVRRIRCD